MKDICRATRKHYSAEDKIRIVLDRLRREDSIAELYRLREVRTDNGHEFQAKFHWHVEDKGIRHAYIQPASPQLNGKVERSHRTDEQEFYQLDKRGETRQVVNPNATPATIAIIA